MNNVNWWKVLEKLSSKIEKLPEVKSAKANRKKNIVIITLNSEVDEENLQKTIENCNKKYLGIQN